MPTTLDLLRQRGYAAMPDGSFCRRDSAFVPPPVIEEPKPEKKEKKKRGPNPFALKFEALWGEMNLPELLPEFKFHPTRKWRFDYVHPPTKVAIELEGGIFTGGRHGSATGMQQDAEKYNAAIICGYRVFRLPTGTATRENLQMIADFIRSRP